MFTANKLKRAWFSKDKEEGNVKPWAQGENSMCQLPLSHPTTTLNVLLISWGSYCWQWSVAGLSLLAHMHTPPGWPLHWQEDHYAHYPIFPTWLHSLHDAILFTQKHSVSSCASWSSPLSILCRQRRFVPHTEDSLCFGSRSKKGNDFWTVITFFCWGCLPIWI